MTILLALFMLGQSDLCTEAVPVTAFQPVPCTGVLWPESFTADALEIMQVDFPKCQVKLESARGELSVCDGTIMSVRQECDRTIDRFAKLTKEAAQIHRPWWDNNTLWGGAGFVSGVVIAVLIVSAAR